MKRIAFTVLMAAAVSQVALTAAGNPAFNRPRGIPVPPFDAFWAVKPGEEPGTTALLWQFDSKDDVGQQALDEALDDVAALTGADPGATLLPGLTMMSEAKPELKGDATAVPDCRFGSGIRLAGRGAVAGAAGFPGLVRAEGAATLDFWVQPEAGAAEAVLAALPGADGKSLLRVIRSAEGRVELRCGPEVLVAHPRAAPAGRWTHVAVALEAGGGGQLLVNGTEAAIAGAGSKTLAAAWLRLGAMLWLGAGCELESGLRGRLDSVRISRRERLFYELEDDTLLDPKAARPLAKGPPWFAKETPLPLSCSFDGTLKPEQFAGAQVLGKAAPSDFREGVRGQALDLSRAAANGIAFAGAVLPARQGTLEFWFRPLDWNNFFLRAKEMNHAYESWLPLLQFESKDGSPVRALRIAMGREHDAPGWVRFHPGRWTHVLCAWDDSGVDVYLDGEPQKLIQIVWDTPRAPWWATKAPGLRESKGEEDETYKKWLSSSKSKPHGAAPPPGLPSLDNEAAYREWLKADKGRDELAYRLAFSPCAPRVGAGGRTDGLYKMESAHTLIDELRVYPYTFLPEEARNAYVRYFPDASARLTAMPPIRVDCGYDFLAGRFTARLSCLPIEGVNPVTASIKVVAPDGAVAMDQAGVALDEVLRGVAAANAEMALGRFAVSVESKAADGRTLATVVTDYVRKSAWENCSSSTLIDGKRAATPGASGVKCNRLTGEVYMHLNGHGVWKSADKGRTWTRMDNGIIGSNDGSGHLEVGCGLDQDQEHPARIAAFTLDGWAGHVPKDSDWTRWADVGRNWDYGAVDWSAAVPRTILALRHADGGRLYVSTDAGQSWTPLTVTVNPDVNYHSMLGVMDANTLVYSDGGNGIMRSTDLGASWTQVSRIVTTSRQPVLFKGTFYIGTEKGLAVSTDKGASWELRGGPERITHGPFFGADENVMVVVSTSGVHKSVDAGATWNKLCDLKREVHGARFPAYAWDPVHDCLYATGFSMPGYRYDLK